MATLDIPKVITFDCYDTLCEFRIDDFTRELVADRAAGVDLDAMLKDYEGLRLHTTTHAPYAPYREVLRDTQREIFTRHGIAWRESDAEALLADIVTWGPFPDVPPALETLRQHCKLAIISNSDDDIMARNVANIGVPIDYVITARQAGAYKPAQQTFDYALSVIGVPREEVLHVAQGFEYDMVPAQAMGWTHVWINRYGLPGDQTYGPYYEQTDLGGVVKLLGLDQRTLLTRPIQTSTLMTMKDTRRSALALAVLALLSEEPMHPYRMQQLIKQRHKEAVVNVRLRSSLYQTINRLERAGLIAVQETEKADNRPERTIYRLTLEGAATARQWLREMLAHPVNEYPQFPAALSFLPLLSPHEALALLITRAEALVTEIAEIDHKLSAVGPWLPRLFILEVDYQRTMMETERLWLQRVIAEFQSGALHWDDAWLQEQKTPPEEVMRALGRM